MEQNSNNIPELQSPFEQLKEVDADGKEWWNSRKLAQVMGYGKYWNFERVIAKAQAWTSQKGYHLGEHFVEITEMAELGNGAVREVTSIRLSRAACMAVAMNADQKKEMVKAASQRSDKHSTFSCGLHGCGYECRPKERDGEGCTAIFQRDHDSIRCREKHGVLYFDV